jgi:hypothetical protein
MIKRVNRGRSHSYVDTDTGQTIPGVTTILGDGLPKPALIGWAANTTAEYAVDRWEELAALTPSKRLKELQAARFADRDAAAGRGTAVHKLAEQLVAGKDIEVPDPLRGHVEAYVDFLDQWDVQPQVIEGVVVNYKHRYAGTLDLIADVRGRGTWLLDVKTARSGVWPDNALQLAAYRFAEKLAGPNGEHPMPQVHGCAVVHVRADGYSVVPVDAGPDIFRTFLYVAQLWRWANDTSKTVVGEQWPAPEGATT